MEHAIDPARGSVRFGVAFAFFVPLVVVPPFLFLTFFLGLTVIVTAASILTPPLYRGETTLLVEKAEEEPLVPVVTTTPTIPGTPTLVTIPGNGVWVRVEYNGSFIGYVGNPGSLQHVGGSGDRFYYIPKSDDLVQASLVKQDNSGNTLTIEVYRNGEMVLHRTTRAPKGEVQVLIDPRTGNPPGITTTAVTL